jgi:DNA-binding PadR family transcriptional regulator
MALVLLALLRDRPMHGYELRSELERVLPGYRPSPGAVYPALAGLVEEGLLQAIQDAEHARRRAFKITAAGRAALQRRRSALAAFEVRTGGRLSNGSVVDAALDPFRVRVMDVAERVDADLVVEELHKAAARLEAAASPRGGRQHG